MAHIIILGAGIGGLVAAYDMKEHVGPNDKVTVVTENSYFQFTPSNPWLAVNWRSRDDITFELKTYLERKGIDLIVTAAKRVHPEENRIELIDGTSVTYDYLVIATGPKLAFEEVEGAGPAAHTQSICTVNHAETAAKAWDGFVKDPGHIVVGALQGASCYGPAYEFAMIMDTDLRRRKIRSKVPMTFVTAEPYVGHLGLGGVGDSKGMIESILREKHIKWICNAKVSKVEAGKMFVTEHDENGQPKKEHVLDFKYSMMLPAFKGVDAVIGIEGLANPRGFMNHVYTPPYCQQFGVFSQNEVSAEALASFINSIPQRFRHVDLNLNESNLDLNESDLDVPNGLEIHRNRNLVLQLNKPANLIAQSFTRNHKRNIRKACRAGLIYDVADDAEKVIEIFESGRGRTLGDYSDMDHSLFRVLLRELQQRGKATILIANSADGDTVAGAVFFMSHDGAYFIFSGTSESGKKLSAMHGLIGHFLESHSAGLAFLDFEGSHLDDLARFYAGFGADEALFVRIVRT
jgi:hypothetical protein